MSKRQATGIDEQDFWRMVLESQAASGLAVQAFCDKEGISPSSFYRWRKLLRFSLPPTSVSDVPSSCGQESPEPMFLSMGSISSFEQVLRIAFPAGIEVTVSNGCDTALLSETVRLLCERRC